MTKREAVVKAANTAVRMVKAEYLNMNYGMAIAKAARRYDVPQAWVAQELNKRRKSKMARLRAEARRAKFAEQEG